MPNDKIEGTVKWFDANKGYGFIRREGGTDIFVHISAVRASNLQTLSENEQVRFKVTQNPRNAKPCAEDLELV